MPKGPAGAPRPAASSTLSITIELNSPDGEPSEMVINNLTQRLAKVDNISIRSETESIPDTPEFFDKAVIDITLDDSNVRLIEVEDLVADIEEALGEERVGVVIEAV